MIKVILVGRHAGAEIPGVEIIEARNITWPNEAAAAVAALTELENEASRQGARVLLQAVPGVLAAGLARSQWASGSQGGPGSSIGVIVSKPGPRLTGVQRIFWTHTGGEDVQYDFSSKLAEAIAFANPNAKVQTFTSEDSPRIVRVTVDPLMKFEFSHIEWL